MNKRGSLIVLSGPSGVGKGTVLTRYLQGRQNVRLSVSATTRAPRPGEEDGVHYYFLSPGEFEEKIAASGMLEWARYNNNYYGTPKEYVERALEAGEDVILEIEVQGALQVKAAMPGALLIFVMPPSFGALTARLLGRGTEDKETVRRRLKTARDELQKAAQYDYMIVNDTVEAAAQSLDAVIAGAKCLTAHNREFIAEVCNDAETYFVAN